MYCPHCGAQNSDEARFCSQCGGRLSDLSSSSLPIPVEEMSSIMPAPSPAEPPTESTSATSLVPDLSQLTDATGAAPATCPMDTKPKGNSAKWIAIAIGILVLFCCCCAMLLFLTQLMFTANVSSPIFDLLQQLPPTFR